MTKEQVTDLIDGLRERQYDGEGLTATDAAECLESTGAISLTDLLLALADGATFQSFAFAVANIAYAEEIERRAE
jgi:hypothetical protein